MKVEDAGIGQNKKDAEGKLAVPNHSASGGCLLSLLTEKQKLHSTHSYFIAGIATVQHTGIFGY